MPRNYGSYYAKEFVEKLISVPYPLEVDFLNLAAGGDTISDMGSSIVTPREGRSRTSAKNRGPQ